MLQSAGGRFDSRIKVGPGTALLQRKLQPPVPTGPRTQNPYIQEFGLYIVITVHCL